MTTHILPLISVAVGCLMILACGNRSLSESDAQKWDAKLVAIGQMMIEQKKPAAMIDDIILAAKSADTVFPYLEQVMAGNADEKRKSAALMVFTSAYMLISSRHLEVSRRADDFVQNLNQSSATATALLADQERVPTFKNYQYTIDK